MADYQKIYEERAPAYDRMVSAEDAEGHLQRLLGGWVDAGCSAVDVGCGTGRVTRYLLAAGAGEVVGVEPATGMIEEARRRLAGQPVTLIQGDALELPVADNSGDLVIAGWVFGHFGSWHPEDWRARLDRALAEFDRISRPGATQIVIETMGTGTDGPAPPHERLAAYYRILREAYGFEEHVVQTDYQFESTAEAAQSVRFFFGDALAERVLAEDTGRVPEWTGVWRRTAQPR